VEARQATVHGHRVAYREQDGPGPVVVLVHGIAGSARTWDAVAPLLAADTSLIAPDLLGHGLSAKPKGDYSLGAFASGIRDLLGRLGHDRVTIVGHSLGGGVALQFAYQFPQHTERLVLVSSGGLGREVTAALRAATLPGAELVLPLVGYPGWGEVGASLGRALGKLRVPLPAGMAEIGRHLASLGDAQARRAFLATARAVIDISGQRIDATDRLYLAQRLPLLIVWGGRDHFIPVEHGRHAAALVPGSRLEVFDRAGHFPHVDEPQHFADVLTDFLHSTEPASLTNEDFRDLLGAEHPSPSGGQAS
jgi:pimeloyl-ACP methyl ester carboxylesterase